MTTQSKEVKEIQETIIVPNIVEKMFSPFMGWSGMSMRIDFNGLMQVVAKLEKRGYVVVIDCEVTYLHYPKSAKDKKFETFINSPKIRGIYRACLTAVRHYYN